MKCANIDPSKILDILKKKTRRIQDIVSITLVGSASSKHTINISDIDVVIILKTLNQKFFNECIQQISTITDQDLGFFKKKVIINSTFGPLKYDTEDTIVIHCMIYDIQGHKDHVINSPMTCWDWERSSFFHGKSLQSIYPVITLQLKDFLDARRGLHDYIEDIESGVISYREYSFSQETIQAVKKQKPLDPRLIGEYAYHIVKNLINNFIKWRTQKNDTFDYDLWTHLWKEYLPKSSIFIPWYEILYQLKINTSTSYPNNTLQQLKDFLNAFEQDITDLENSLPKITCVRHYKTHLNDGTFLGQGRDPSIINPVTDNQPHRFFDSVYSSPKKRCLETAKIITHNTQYIQTDDRLLEFNYGTIEGMSIEAFRKEYVTMLHAWKNHEDPCFPHGENTQAVWTRFSHFLEDIPKKPGNTLIVTHNGVMRCMVGNTYGLPMWSWHRLNIAHGSFFEWIYIDHAWRPLLSPELKTIIQDTLISL